MAAKRRALLARFDHPQPLTEAARQCRAQGYRDIDAFTPFPVEGLTEAIGFEERRLPWITLAGGIVGGAGTFLLQYYLNGVDYPLNVGGRPLFSWPAFAVPGFELTVLGAALAGLFGMLWLNGLPRLHHPVFDAEGFERATQDRFFLAVAEPGQGAELEPLRALLGRLGVRSIQEIEA